MTAVTAPQLRGFLAREGWERVGADAVGESWASSDPDAPAVLVPTRRDDPAYPALMDMVLARLEWVTRVSREELVRRIVAALADIFEVRVVDPSTDGGRIPLARGVQLAQSLQTIVLNGARLQFAGGKLVHSGGLSEAAKDVMNRLQMAPPTAGSFRYTILAPVEPQLSIQAPGSPPPDPVHETLVSAVTALDAARKTTEEPIPADAEELDDAVTHGVSANLVRAVRALDTQSPALRLEFRASWAAPAPATPDLVTLDAEHLARMPSLETVLTQQHERANFRLEGWIKEVMADEFAPLTAAVVGSVVVETHVGKQRRDVRVEMAGANLRKAGAGVGKRWVKATGRLERIGRSWYLSDPESIRIAEPPK
jgi:hypothetical protein